MCPRLRLARLASPRGETLVEFALSATMFLSILFGIVQFGLAVWQYNMVANLAQEGARWAAVRGATATTPATTESVAGYVTSRSVIGTPTVSTTWNPSTKAKGSTVTVTVSKDFSLFTPIVRVGTITLQSSAQMIVAR